MKKTGYSLQRVLRRRPPLPVQRNLATRPLAAGEDRYCIRIQPPLACDAVERCRWASSFIKASGIKVIKHLHTVDRYCRLYDAYVTKDKVKELRKLDGCVSVEHKNWDYYWLEPSVDYL